MAAQYIKKRKTCSGNLPYCKIICISVAIQLFTFGFFLLYFDADLFYKKSYYTTPADIKQHTANNLVNVGATPGLLKNGELNKKTHEIKYTYNGYTPPLEKELLHPAEELEPKVSEKQKNDSNSAPARFYIGTDFLDDENAYNIAKHWSNDYIHKWPEFDFTWAGERQENLKILFVETYRDYQRKMDRYLYDWVEAAQAHPNLEVTLWGKDFPGFLSTLSLTQNLIKKFGSCDYFDLVVASPLPDGRVTGVLQRKNHIPDVCGKTILMHEFNDCHEGKCLKNWTPVHILSFRYAFIPMELFDSRTTTNLKLKKDLRKNPRLLAHNPDCACRANFKPVEWRNKSIDAMLYGNSFEYLYPLRYKVKIGILTGKINAKLYKGLDTIKHKAPNVLQLNHPRKYLPENTDIDPNIQVQRAWYGRSISKTKICIFDTTVVRKAIKKFMEAAMGGCVPATDLPFEMEEILGPAVIALNAKWSAQKIGITIQNALDNDKELQKKAAYGLYIARTYFSCERKVERMLQLLKKYRSGFRGYYFPYGYSLGCHSYLKPYDVPNQWCESSRRHDRFYSKALNASLFQ